MRLLHYARNDGRLALDVHKDPLATRVDPLDSTQAYRS